jgi:hypothetical protein
VLSFGVAPDCLYRRIDVVTCDFTPTPLPVQPGSPGQQSDNRDQEEQWIDHHGAPVETLSLSVSKGIPKDHPVPGKAPRSR